MMTFAHGGIKRCATMPRPCVGRPPPGPQPTDRSHVSKLPPDHTELLGRLVAGLRGFATAVRRTAHTDASASVREERRTALATITVLMGRIKLLARSPDGGAGAGGAHPGGKRQEVRGRSWVGPHTPGLLGGGAHRGAQKRPGGGGGGGKVGAERHGH
jgi:hypothetical protein